MADTQKIAIQPRALTGKKVNSLRREGVLPGVVFGGHKDSTNVQTDQREFERGYRRWGNTTLVSLEGLTEGDQPALIHDVSWNKPDDHCDSERYQHDVIDKPQHRNEVRDEVYRRERVPCHSQRQRPCIPRSAWITRRKIDSAHIALDRARPISHGDRQVDDEADETRSSTAIEGVRHFSGCSR